MRIIIILFVLTSIWITGFSQTEKKAEKSALKCIDNTLAIVNKDFNYLIESSIEYQNLISNMDMEKFEKKKKEVDSILTKCGLYKLEHLDINLLKDCMQSSYDLRNEKNDTASAYYQLLSHLIYSSDNPSIFKEISPSLHMEAIKTIITTDNQDSVFYNVISFILFQGIVKEFENYAKSRKDSENISLIDIEADTKRDYEIITIVDDDFEIAEEMTLDKPITSDSQCGGDIFFIVEKMPEYNGGKEAVKNYLHVNSPDTKGKVYIQFVIDCHGKVINPKILRGITPSTDKVAIDLIKAMPDWIPGEQSGKKVNVQKTYAVIFE
jgi:hypothetical protein